MTSPALERALTDSPLRPLPAPAAELRRTGVPAHLARFAGSHGSWDQPGITLDDLLVSLADKVWKAARVPDLEERVGVHLGGPPWAALLLLDDVLQDLAAGADERLAFQSAHPVG